MKCPISVLVFVPSTLGQSAATKGEGNEALLVGWRITTSDAGCILVVAGAVTEAQARQAKLTSDCSKGEDDTLLHILGTLEAVPTQSQGCASKSTLRNDEYTKATVWIRLQSRCTKRTRKIEVMGFRTAMPAASETCAVTLVHYRIPRPDQMRYLALEPMVLPLAATAEQLSGQSDISGADAHASEQQERLERLVRLDPVRFADLNRKYPKGQAPGEGFRAAIELINTVYYEMDRLQRHRGEAKQSGDDEHVGDIWRALHTSCSAFRATLNKRLLGTHSLVTSSACARQLSRRLGQLIVWPALGRRLRALRIRDRDPVAHLAPRYTALYNGVWLVANDIIVGQSVGSWLCEHRVALAEVLRRHLRPMLVVQIVEMLRWLDSWPLGVKLNTPLSRFFSDMFTGMTEVWCELLRVPHEDGNDDDILATLVFGIGMTTRVFGVSMLLCILIDVVRLAALHLTVFYSIQQAVYAFFCRSIASLFHLFRGKKRNPLRGMRVDRATYDLDQLLLGTLFFTLIMFLWLTVATYYVHFAAIRLGVVVLVTVLQTMLATINHLPLFAIMLRLKDPARLPGGVALRYFEEVADDDNDDGDTRPLPVTHAELINTPLGLGSIFRGHVRNLRPLQRLPHRIVDIIVGRRI